MQQKADVNGMMASTIGSHSSQSAAVALRAPLGRAKPTGSSRSSIASAGGDGRSARPRAARALLCRVSRIWSRRPFEQGAECARTCTDREGGPCPAGPSPAARGVGARHDGALQVGGALVLFFTRTASEDAGRPRGLRALVFGAMVSIAMIARLLCAFFSVGNGARAAIRAHGIEGADAQLLLQACRGATFARRFLSIRSRGAPCSGRGRASERLRRSVRQGAQSGDAAKVSARARAAGLAFFGPCRPAGFAGKAPCCPLGPVERRCRQQGSRAARVRVGGSSQQLAQTGLSCHRSLSRFGRRRAFDLLFRRCPGGFVIGDGCLRAFVFGFRFGRLGS